MPTTEDGNKVPWTTREELLLTFAVKRHGCRNWDSVATEIQTRTSLPATPDACRLQFHDLRRRFASQNNNDDDDNNDDLTIPWAEDLRRLRLDELRAEVNRHDLSISSLQLKVKKLEQDREQSLKEEEDSALKPDLEPSNNNNLEAVDRHADRESDPENQSVNGSNSTGPDKAKNRGSGQKEVDSTRPGSDHKTEPLPPGSKQNESSTSRSSSDESSAKGLSIDRQKNHEAGTKTGSDVQSSATLSSKRRREKEALEADGGVTAESQPLVNVLTLLRSHKDSSLFEQRLQNQETEKLYNNVVRQHMDLQTIQHNLDSGSYTSSHLSFFRDLLLMFTNSIIFLPKSSPEFKAAEELRSIVTNQMDERFKPSRRDEEKPSSAPPSPGTKPVLERSDLLLAKHKSSGGGPIVVCRKRSSKSNLARKGEPQSDVGDDMKTVALTDLNPASPKEEPSLLSSKTKNRIVTGTRSLRRSNTNIKNHVTLPSAADGTGTSNSSKKETANTIVATTNEKKEELSAPKKEELSALKKDDTSAKKKGAADFLKRLKGNSPVKSRDVKSEAKSSAAKGNSSTGSGEQKKKSGHGDKADGRKKMATRQSDLGKQSSKTERATSPAKRNVGRPSKKTLEPIAPAIKRGRDTEVSASTASKQPKKRIRR